MEAWITLGLMFSLALSLAYVITPLIQRLAIKINALDLPGERKLHRQPVPRLGGIAIYLAFLIALNIGVLLSDTLLRLFEHALRGWLGLFFGGSVVLALGIVDDIYQLRPVKKLLFQTLAALIVYLSGLHITQIASPFNGSIELGWLALPATVFWIVGITNAMNLIDGLDGLASGIALIITATILFLSLVNGKPALAVISAVLCGSTLGFLRYNFNPARIFMGDSGSMFLGFTLAVLAVQGTQKSSTAVAILIPLLFFGLPIADTSLALWRRMIKKPRHDQAVQDWKLFRGDREHIHHKLLDLGLSHRSAVLTLYVVTGGLSALALTLTAVRSELAALILTALGLLTLVVLHVISSRIPKIRRVETRVAPKL